MASLNKVLLIDLYRRGKSIPLVAIDVGVSRSTVRYHLKAEGILRSRAEGVAMAAKDGRLGGGNRGKSIVFTDEWKRNMSLAHKRRAEVSASGVSLKPNGYIEITRGANKGRGQHRVIAEQMLLRKLRRDEHVHHIDGNRANNDPSNLRVMIASDHARHHANDNHTKRHRDAQGRFK